MRINHLTNTCYEMKFFIIGIGNVGLRHMQGLTCLQDRNLEFYLFDNNDLYKKRFNQEIEQIENKHHINKVSNIEELKDIDFELTIIATTATDRSNLLSKIINKIKTKFILIEKPICQSEKELEDLKKITNKNIFVNFPRRYCEWHKKIKKKLLLAKFNKISKVEVSGGYIGLACNTCHFIDLLNFWSGKYPTKIDMDELGEWYISKRDGFYEVEGNMKIYYGKDFLLELSSFKIKKDLELNIYDDKKKLILNLNYTKGYAKFSDGEVIQGSLKFQSENTHNLLKLMQTNNKEICSLNNAVYLYDLLIKELIKNWNIKFKKNDKKIMIT